MMSIPETPPAGEATRSVHAKSSHKRTATVVATLFLAIAFSFAGAPAATAAPAYCKGGPPGPCSVPGGHAGQHLKLEWKDNGGFCGRPGVCHE